MKVDHAGRGCGAFPRSHEFLASPRVFAEFVASWEAGTLPKSKWTHAAHVAVGTHYTLQSPNTAFERMKNGVIRHNESVGTENSDASGYHETLTRLWIDVLAGFVRRTGFTDPWKAVCAAVERFGKNKDLHRAYYSFDVVRSVAARRAWIPPDVTPEENGEIEPMSIGAEE
jgi:hypothetical protein